MENLLVGGGDGYAGLWKQEDPRASSPAVLWGQLWLDGHPRACFKLLPKAKGLLGRARPYGAWAVFTALRLNRL